MLLREKSVGLGLSRVGSRYLKGGAYAGWSTLGSRKKLTQKCVWILHWRRMGETGLFAEGSTAEIVGESGTWRAFQQHGASSWFFSQLIESCPVVWPFYAAVIWVITLYVSSPLSRGKIALSYWQFWGGEKIQGYYFLQQIDFLNQNNVSARMFQQNWNLLLRAP